MWPDISIVIINYNGGEYLPKLFESILAQSYPKEKIEIIFVDDNSIDNSIKIARQYKKSFKRFKIISNKENKGHAFNVNLGVKNASSEFVIILDSDVYLHSEFCKTLIEDTLNLLKEDAKICAVGGAQYDYYEIVKLTSVGGTFDIIGTAVMPTLGLPYSEIKNKRIWVSSAGMLVLKSNFVRIGGFDEDFFIYGDDPDYCLRGLLYGYDTYLSRAKYYHKSGSTIGKISYKSRFFRVRNSGYIIIKNYPSKILCISFPLFIIFQLMYTCFFVLISRDIRYFISFFKGLASIMVNMNILLRKRKEISSRALHSRYDEMLKRLYKGIIGIKSLDLFIKGKLKL